MQPLGDPRGHYWRVIGMSHACNVDLEKARDGGALSSASWADMVQRCRGCPCVGQCDRSLARGDVAAAPDYCVNQASFERLKAAMR